MENKIIEAEFKEVTEDISLERLASEINIITEQANKTLLNAAIEIGKRFAAAKLEVEHGKFAQWCADNTDYSQRMAENYIKIYNDYGKNQMTLWGDLRNSHSISGLGVSKLLLLSAIPPDEREEFVEENNITDNTTVQELKKLLSQKEADEKIKTDEIERLKEAIEKKQEEIDSTNRTNKEYSDRISELNKHIEELENSEPAAADNSDMTRMIEEAREEERSALQKEIDKFKDKAKKSKEKQEKLQLDIDRLTKEKQEAQEREAEKQKRLNEAEAERAELKRTIEKMKSEAAKGRDDAAVRLNIKFEAAQEAVGGVMEALADIEDTAKHDKFKSAIVNTIEKILKESD